MKKKFIADLKAGDHVEDIFFLESKTVVGYKSKPGSFLRLVLCDKSGRIETKLWDYDPDSHSVMEKTFLVCRGAVVEYSDTLELHLKEYTVINREDIDPKDFLPVTPCDMEVMKKELEQLVQSISDPFLKQLLCSFRKDERLFGEFVSAPAAKMMHQAYLGGLLEHSLNTAKIVASVSGLYPNMNKDMALAGALLHDLGKIFEYEYDFAIDMTDEGRLLGHIILGLQALDLLIMKIPDFPEELRLSLRHIITSHHGRYEWQSPKRPKTIEACLVHYADAMEADLWKFNSLKEKHKGERWSPWDRGLERFVYLGGVVENSDEEY